MRSIDSINRAYRNIINTFGADSPLVNHIQDALYGIENLELTKSDYVSKKTKDKLALEAADKTIKNMTDWFKYTTRAIEDNNKGASKDEQMSVPRGKAQMIQATNAIVEVFDEYADSLNEFYSIEEAISMSASDVSEDIRQSIRGAIADIRLSISHPGTWALPAHTMRQNESKISKLKQQWQKARER